ncbi:hypothetical protein LWI28_029115 [Acer negundo]|uniref:GAG-pre-integrase domain-containing protein n=1 Tax=Acer negundo TaxID=4023 RepID=A0AAD5NMH7_ACENE|nr:hypothetical protein LWI28_029115 [Acer negundo]
MCPNRQWFSSFQELDAGVVLMGNDNTCQTKGIGTVRLKMHDGTIRRLTDVWYVPDLKKNLISLGVLDSSSYKVTMEGGVLKVVLGAFLAMKGTRQRNLYFLDRYTVTGRATVSSSSDDEASDTSRLWHMRLGHVEEKALQGLVKQGLLKVKGFRLWNSESKKIILSRDVTFEESAMLKQTFRDTKNENPNSLQQVEFEVPKKSEKASPTVDGHDDQDEILVEVEDSAPLSEIRQQPESIATSRPKRDIRKLARYTDMVAYALPATDGSSSNSFSTALSPNSTFPCNFQAHRTVSHIKAFWAKENALKNAWIADVCLSTLQLQPSFQHSTTSDRIMLPPVKSAVLISMMVKLLPITL